MTETQNIHLIISKELIDNSSFKYLIIIAVHVWSTSNSGAGGKNKVKLLKIILCKYLVHILLFENLVNTLCF